ncbi:hypothetical protein WCN91_09735 [Pseudoalteromonas sp. YIC-827]|uniref:Uncharacterized protein n=1 Tax=Pseudoalteromonas qingdaonensis TaxID=3131913 RepID=A0ABU9MWP1_9GAMM
MVKIKRFSTEDDKVSIEIYLSQEGSFVLQKFVQKYDSEEEVFYEVRVTPDPAGLFGDIDSATQEAKALIGLE